MSSSSSSICPGQQTLMGGDGAPYLRAVFTAYWNNAEVSAEPFYLHNHPFKLSLSGIKKLEEEVLAALQKNASPTAMGVVYLGYEGIVLSDDDVQSVGWRLLTGSGHL